MIDHPTAETVTVRRVHQARAELVFACLTMPEHLTHFWGPVGTHTPISNIVVDLRPGGAFETTMVNDETGDTYTMRAMYVDVVAPSFLSWREVESRVLTEVTFTDLGDGTTEVVTTQRGLPMSMRTPQARAGWGSALDRAAAYTAALAGTPGRATRRLLLAGAAAGPIFVISSLAQATLRGGFDPAQQPPSALALGGLGWIQSVTFVLAGLGFAAGAVGLGRAVRRSRGRAAAWFVGVFGLALMAGGLFRMDPAFGFPPGTPDGVGASVSCHAAIHGVLFPLGFVSILAAGWLLSRRYAAQRRPVLRWFAILVGPAVLALSSWPNIGSDPQGRFWPMWVGVAVAFGWVSFALADATRTRVGSTADLNRRTTT